MVRKIALDDQQHAIPIDRPCKNDSEYDSNDCDGGGVGDEILMMADGYNFLVFFIFQCFLDFVFILLVSPWGD